MDENKKAKTMCWAGWALTVLSMVPFVPSLIMKLSMSPQVVEGMAKAGFEQSAIMTIAILELLSIVLYLIPKTAVLGAIVATGYLGGAICTHLRGGESVLIPVLLGVTIWGGLFLRDARVRALIPLRK